MPVKKKETGDCITIRYFAFSILWILTIGSPLVVTADFSASTTLTLSICGNMVVDPGEQCDVVGETGVYSQTILGETVYSTM